MMQELKETQYVHGYSASEQKRLLEQGQTLADYVFQNIDFKNHKHILEIGMGVGAQTIQLLQRFPYLHITGVELSEVQLTKARKNLAAFPQFVGRYDLIHADAKELSGLDTSSMDAVAIIWVLEHVPQPEKVLDEIHRVMQKGTIVHIVEIFHNSLFLYPHCPEIMNYWRKCNNFQYFIGGDPNVGTRLGNLLNDAGYRNIQVLPLVLLLDKRASKERLVMLQYWKELMHSVLDSNMNAGYVTLPEWEGAAAEVDALIQNPETIFYYTSMHGVAQV